MKSIDWRQFGFGLIIVMASTAAAASGADADGDGVADSLDNCSQHANPDQRDSNGDGFGNACDPDLNNDLIVNPVDLGLFRSAFFSTDADADFNGDGVVNPIDLGILRVFFFGPPGPGAVAPTVTWTNDVQPIFSSKCTPCHTGLGVGDHNVGSVYTDALLPADSSECNGLLVGACTIVLIQSGEMPQGAGCTGNPALDEGNAACLTQAEQDSVQAWIDAGLPE